MEILNDLIEKIKFELESKNVRWKENDKELIILCPYCLQEGKEKLKLYISKENLLWHCFRCGNKGNFITVQQPLSLHGLTSSVISLREAIYENFDKFIFTSSKTPYISYKEYLSSQEEIDEFIRQLSNERIRLENYLHGKTIQINLSEIKENKELSRYMIKRSIPSDLFQLANFDKYNLHPLIGIKEELSGRFIVKGFLGVNFEGRRFVYDKSPKVYKYRSSISDFPLALNEKDKTKTLIVVEGLFDMLKALIVYPYYSYLSLGGWNNHNKLMFFLKTLKIIYGIKFNKIIFVFDRDIKTEKLNEISKLIVSNYGQDFEFMKIIRFNFGIYKDIGDVLEYDYNDLIDYLVEIAY